MTHFMKWCCGIDAPTTQTTARERECLAKHATGKRRLVEIGVWEGVTARQIRQNMSPSATYFAVDPYPRGRLGFSTQSLIAHRAVNSIDRGKVVWLRTTGAMAAVHPEVAGQPVDWIFIDGDHSYEGLRADWTAWRDKIAPDGIVALHDSRATEDRPIEQAGSVRFTQDTILIDPAFEKVDEVDSLTVLRRKTS